MGHRNTMTRCLQFFKDNITFITIKKKSATKSMSEKNKSTIGLVYFSNCIIYLV